MYEYIHEIVHIHTYVLYMCGKFPGYLHIQQKFNLRNFASFQHWPWHCLSALSV